VVRAQRRPDDRGGRCRSGCVCELAQLLEAAADHARDVHLREPDELADLALSQVLLEAQAQDLPLAGRQACQQRCERRPLLCGLKAAVGGSEAAVEDRLLGVVAGAGRWRQRREGARRQRLAGVEDGLFIEAGLGADLRDRR
jgi:hypothetical protein